ncbi:MAG: response regulator [Comamonadaceae bacterium]|nr:response regulator [Comamonadaceae bacterium]
MQMPRMNGVDAARSIRTLPNGETTPILALTANAFGEDRLACIEAGMNGFITKPVDPESLYGEILDHLSRATARTPRPGLISGEVQLPLTRLRRRRASRSASSTRRSRRSVLCSRSRRSGPRGWLAPRCSRPAGMAGHGVPVSVALFRGGESCRRDPAARREAGHRPRSWAQACRSMPPVSNGRSPSQPASRRQATVDMASCRPF